MTGFPLIDLLPRLVGVYYTLRILPQTSDVASVLMPTCSTDRYQTSKPRQARGPASDMPALQFRKLSAGTNAHRRCSNWSLSWQTCLTLTSCPGPTHEKHTAFPDSALPAFRLAATRFPSHFAAPLPAWGLHWGSTLNSAEELSLHCDSSRPRVRPRT